MNTILIFGACGTRGSAILDALTVDDKYDVVGLDRRYCDVRFGKEIRNVVDTVMPAVVINCTPLTLGKGPPAVMSALCASRNVRFLQCWGESDEFPVYEDPRCVVVQADDLGDLVRAVVKQVAEWFALS